MLTHFNLHRSSIDRIQKTSILPVLVKCKGKERRPRQNGKCGRGREGSRVVTIVVIEWASSSPSEFTTATGGNHVPPKKLECPQCRGPLATDGGTKNGKKLF